MKKFLKINFIVLSVILILLNLTGCGNKKNDKDENLKNKINSEISYVDNQLVSMANALNNISYSRYEVIEKEVESITNSSAGSESDAGTKGQEENKTNEESKEESKETSKGSGDNESKEGDSKGGSGESKEGDSKESSGDSKEAQDSKDSEEGVFLLNSNLLDNKIKIQWEEYANKVENLYTILTVLSIDLKEIGVIESEIEEFSDTLDALAVSVVNKQEDEILNNIVKLYSFLPKFINEYDRNNTDSEILETKYNLLVCYKDVNSENWEEIEKSIENLKMSFSNVSNNKEKYNKKEINISSANFIINEIQNTMGHKVKNVFFVKYKNLMQELNILHSS